MKHLFFSFSLLIAMTSYGQNEQQTDQINSQTIVLKNPKTCEEIKANVLEMAKRKEFVYVTYGLVSNPMTGYPNFVKLLTEKYHIKLESKGCMVTPQDMCYAHSMNAAIEKEYGSNFIHLKFEEFLNITDKK